MKIKKGDTMTVVQRGDVFTMVYDGVLYRGVVGDEGTATLRPTLRPAPARRKGK